MYFKNTTTNWERYLEDEEKNLNFPRANAFSQIESSRGKNHICQPTAHN